MKLSKSLLPRHAEITILTFLLTPSFEKAVPFFFQAYKIFQQVESPNKEYPERYLSAIINEIGESRFKELLKS